VIASPVYWFTVSAQTKVFIDRCYGFFDGERNQLAGTRIGILMAYEDDDPFVSGAVNALRTFQDMFDYVGAPIVGMVYGQALDEGEIRKNPEVWTAAYELGRKLGRGSA
jgi:multimeric flavodoxin WrbA